MGILGGTFDPIHQGHIHIARCVRSTFQLERIIFMVAKTPPHKEHHGISEVFHRYAMVSIELLYSDDFFAGRREIRKGGSSYTIETLEQLQQEHPDDQFLFIAGSDSLREIHLWKDYDKLLANHSMIFVQRPSAEVHLEGLQVPRQFKNSIKYLCPGEGPELQKGQSFLAAFDAPPVSSTMLRGAISRGERLPEQFISPNVYQYILKYRLYERNKRIAEESLPGD